MSFAAQMRVGSLEVIAALFAVAFVAARPRLRALQEAARLVPVALTLRIIEFGAERPFEGVSPLEIGRDPQCGLMLGDPEVSRRHARLETQGGIVFLRDLESSNGTFLNGRRVRSAIEIRDGDEIDIGTTRLIVEGLQPWT